MTQQGYILCRAQGGLNDLTCQIWKCTEYAIKHNRAIILTHWSYFGSDLFDVFDFSNYPVKVYPIDHLKSITYKSVEPAGEEDYIALFMDKPNNIDRISVLHSNERRVFDRTRAYDDSTLLLHDSCGGGIDSVQFFKHIEFTERMKEFFKAATVTFPQQYNALHIRHTDMKVDSVTLLKKLDSLPRPLFIGTDDPQLKEAILTTDPETFSTRFETTPTEYTHNLHYQSEKETLEWAVVDLLVMVFAANTMKDYYEAAQVDIPSGFCRLIDALKPYKSDLLNRISENA
jgi:hypothetical protein